MKETEKHLIEALRNSAEHFMTTDFEWSNAFVHLLLDSADAIEQKKERAEMIGLDGNICYLPNTLRQIVISNPNMGAFKKETLCKAADAIEELLAEKTKLENSGKLLVAAFDRLKERVPKWHPASDPPTRSNPKYAREDFLVRLESGLIMSLTYEFDNSDRCRAGCEPLFPVGWRKTATPVTHWARIPKFELPKEVE